MNLPKNINTISLEIINQETMTEIEEEDQAQEIVIGEYYSFINCFVTF